MRAYALCLQDLQTVVREAVTAIKHNTPSCLTQFVQVLDSEHRTRYLCDLIQQGIVLNSPTVSIH